MDAIQPKLKTKHLLLIAAAAGMVVMFCATMAWQHMFAPVEIPQDGKYLRERAALEATAAQLQKENKAMADTNAMLLDSIKVLLTKPKEIHQNHEQIRQQNWALDDSAAIELWHQRLRAENEYRKRFRYDH